MRGFRLPGYSGSPDMSLWRCFRSAQSREGPRKVWDAPQSSPSGGLVTHPRASLLRSTCTWRNRRAHAGNCEVCVSQPADGPLSRL